MRVATINIPKKLNNGQACPLVLTDAVQAIVTKFGGATVVDGFGYWKDGKGIVIAEPVNVVTVAMDATDENCNALAEIAEQVAVAADQEAVYVINPNGDVLFIEQPKLKAVA